MKTDRANHPAWPAVWLAGFIATFAPAVHAEIVHRTVTYPPGVIAGWPNIDFDADGVVDLSFEHYALGHESGGVMFLVVHSSPTTEILTADGGRGVPLHAGNPISSTNAPGQWLATGYQTLIWSWSFSSPRLGDTNIIGIGGEPPQGDPPTQPPPGQGVGMPGYGDYVGVRFFKGGWRYAWVRFDLLDDTSLPLPQPGWPGVLEYAYETRPNVAILAGAKPVVVPLASPEIVRAGNLRLRWPSAISKAYQVQTKESLTAPLWTNLDFVVVGTTTHAAVDIPIAGAARFFRVVEAD